MKSSSYSSVKTVQKAFKLLEVLAEQQPAKGSQLAKRLGFSRSNLYRMLATLIELGYVEETLERKYMLTFKIFVLGNTIREINQLSILARHYILSLYEMCEENVNLAIRYDSTVLYIDKVESKHYLKLDQPMGKRDPLHCTGLGKVLLSGFTELELETFLKSNSLPSYTENTITDPELLASIIRKVRRDGYATDFEESIAGVHCLASPIYDRTNRVIAAMSISGPTIRLTKQRMKVLRAPLQKATMELSKKMGCTEGPAR